MRRRLSLLVLAATASLVLPAAARQASAQAPEEARHCPAAPLGDPLARPGWNGWGVDVVNSRFQPAAGALTAGTVSRLELKWALGFPAQEFAAGQPSVVGGRIYLGTGPGAVYAFDAQSGCIHWRFPTHHVVRTSVSIGRLPGSPARDAAFFGDLQANVYAVDAETGTHLWTKRLDLHPQARITGAPTFFDGRLYVPVSSLEEAVASSPTYECCTFRGQVWALDAATGQEIWRTYTIESPAVATKKNARGVQQWGPAGAAVWNAPTIDARRGVLYIGTGDGYTAPAASTTDAIIALDLKTGKKVWVNQLTPNDAWIGGCDDASKRSLNCPDVVGPDFDFGQSPILRDLPDGRSLLVVGQKSGIGWALDPDRQGAIVWQERAGKGSLRGGMLFGSAADAAQVYFAVSDVPSGPADAGGLAAVTMATGTRAWFTRPPPVPCDTDDTTRCLQAQAAAISAIPGVVFSGATNGILRAYSTVDGTILWEHDTARAYTTVNGLPARGGRLYGPGPVIVDGALYMTSGYADTKGGKPGNVLLAFGVGSGPAK